jgi:hypothetical protein
MNPETEETEEPAEGRARAAVAYSEGDGVLRKLKLKEVETAPVTIIFAKAFEPIEGNADTDISTADFLTAIELPDTLTAIDPTAFSGLSHKKELTVIIPAAVYETITETDKAAFIDAINLASGETIYVSGIALDETTLMLTVGDNKTLTATVTPATATHKTVTWTSSNTAIATVTGGVITAVGALPLNSPFPARPALYFS